MMGRLMRSCLLGLSAAALVASPLAAQSLDNGSVMAAVEQLKAGEYLWAPQLAPSGPMLLVVNRETQRLVVYRNGLPIGISTVSTGKPGHLTPTGVFTILQKQVVHHSNLYDNAPMPYMQRLTWGGVALHGGNLPGYAASHGCIRLPQAFAEKLYAETKVGMTVVVTDSAELPHLAPAPALLGEGAEPLPGGTVVWQPERAPSGPVSVVVSSADRRVTVLRNGVVIGSAPVALAAPITRPAAYSLQSIEGENRHWMRLPLPGQDAAEPTRDETDQHVTVDEAFRQKVLAAMGAGSTVLLTPDPMVRLHQDTLEPLLESAADDR
ncbi:MAG: L,D-transpeptidase family protein [Sphingomonas sp.]